MAKIHDLQHFINMSIQDLLIKGKQTSDVEHTQSNILYDGNLPFLRLFTLLGSFPLHKDNTGRILFSPLSLNAVYVTLHILVGTAFAGLAIYNGIWSLIDKNFTFEEGLFYGCFMSAQLVQLFPILFYFEANKVATYFNDWQTFQVNMELTPGMRALKVSRWLPFISVISLCVSTSLMAVFWGLDIFNTMYEKYNLNRMLNTIALIVALFRVWVIASFVGLWVILNNTLKNAAILLIENIEELNWLTTRSLKRHITLWLHLQQLCGSLGDTLSFTYLALCAYVFFLALPSLYLGTYGLMITNDYVHISTTLFTLTVITLIADFAHQSVDKVGPSFNSRLTRLIVSKKAAPCEEELIQLKRIIAENPPSISLSGFFTLDRGVNIPLYSSIITYFVIILQYGTSEVSKEIEQATVVTTQR